MRKYLFLLLTAVLTLSLTGCKLFSDRKATVKVTVLDRWGAKVSGEEVFMFTAVTWDDTEKRQAKNCLRSEFTESDGIAVFELNTIEMNWVSDRTTLHFATFNSQGTNETGHAGVTIEKNETKEVTIRMN